ncbi:MAG: hypothetical protein NC238_13390 [Dehalobacter sp.]|nr:hypothetical protein [Dehalobacter sp.]
MEIKVAHLNMIQGVINRMANNSFMLKGWSVVLVSALFALAAKDAEILFVYLAYLPTIVFWGLDGYFLRQERLFRKLYDNVRILPENEINFSMNTSSLEKNVDSWISVVFSKTIWPFYTVLLFSIIAVTFISIILGGKN